MKPTAIFIGNCQCTGIQELLKFTNFFNKYNVLKQYANWELIKDNQSPPLEAIKNADLIIYQPLSDVYGCYSTNINNQESMFNHVKDTAQLISFPRIHNNSLWPIFHKNSSHNIYYGDDFYDYYYNKGISSKGDFLDLYNSGQLDFRFEERFARNIDISRKKEENTLIKVADFIVNNVKSHQLFLTQDHVTSRVFHYCALKICDLLDLSFNDSFDIDSIDINHTRSPDSVYGSTNMMYPTSEYSTKYFGYQWSTPDIHSGHKFYENILRNYLDNKM
jgi:hypothetical protein